MCQLAARQRRSRAGLQAQELLVLEEQHCLACAKYDGSREEVQKETEWGKKKTTEVWTTGLLGTELSVQTIPCLPMVRPTKPRSSRSNTEMQPKHSSFKIQDFLAFSKKPLYDKKPSCLYKGRGRKRREEVFLSTEHSYHHAWQHNLWTQQGRQEVLWAEEWLQWQQCSICSTYELAEQNPELSLGDWNRGKQVTNYKGKFAPGEGRQ